MTMMSYEYEYMSVESVHVHVFHTTHTLCYSSLSFKWVATAVRALRAAGASPLNTVKRPEKGPDRSE